MAADSLDNVPETVTVEKSVYTVCKNNRKEKKQVRVINITKHALSPTFEH